MAKESVTRPRPDWGSAEQEPGPATGILIVGALGVPAIVGAGVGLVLAGPLAALAGALLGALIALAWVGAQATLALKEAGAAPVTSGQARLTGLVAGLSADLGVARPLLHIMERPGRNALVCGLVRPAIAVSRELVETYTRTELEAVVAHCLVRISGGGAPRASLVAALGRLAPRAQVDARAVDVSAAALTRYPPALAVAVAKATPVRGRLGPLYFVSEGPWQPPASARVALLGDL